MPIRLNRISSETEKNYWDNSVKNYAGFYSDFWITRASAADSPWVSLATNDLTGETFCIANNSATTNNIMYSINGGITWVGLSTATLSNSWRSISYGNGVYVVVGAGSTNYLTYSTVNPPLSVGNWTLVASGSNGVLAQSWESVTFGNNLFVSVSSTGATNRIMRSSNGINWTASSGGDLVSWKSITYSPTLNRFVAVANGGTTGLKRCMWSDDAITWNAVTIPENSWNSVTWSSKLNMFLAVSSDGTNRVIWSSNGITWNNITLSATTTNTWQSVTWSPQLEIFIAVANSGTGNRIMSSSDGINWTVRPNSIDNSFTSIIWNRFFGTFISCAGSGTGTRIMTSRQLGIGQTLGNII